MGGQHKMNTEKKLIPLRRFPEFIQDDGWKESIFENTFSFLPNNTLSRAELKEGNGDVYNIHYGDVLIKLNAYTDIQLRKLPAIKNVNGISKYQNARLQDGDIVIADTAEDETVGKCTEIVNTKETIVVSGLHTIPCRPKIKFAQAFLGYYMNSSSFHNKLRPIMQGVKVTSISKTALQNIYLTFPKSLEEQQKIADCLSSIDSYISSVNEKIEQLKVHKKSLMQKLFPQNGQTVPEYRFPEFEKDGMWNFVNGSELFEPIVNKNHHSDLPILAITQDQGAVPREMIDYNVIVSKKSIANYKVVEIGDFIISLRSFQGGVEYSNHKGLCSPAYIVLRKKNDTIYNDFYRHYFKSIQFIRDLNRNLEGIRDGKMVSYQQFSQILIPYPPYEEQHMISNCISSMDKTIKVYSEKVYMMEQYKRGLMEQLFPRL